VTVPLAVLAVVVALGLAAVPSPPAGLAGPPEPALALVRLVPGAPPQGDILLVDPTGGAGPGRARLVSGLAPRVRVVGAPSWSPDGRTLVVASVLEGESRFDIFAVDLDGGAVRRLTDLGDAAWPRVGPDGRRVVFARRLAGATPYDDAWSLWSMALDGTDQRQITPTVPGQTDKPGSWSPDGSTIAFTRSGEPSVGPRGRLTIASAIWLVGAEGADPRPLGEGSAPAFSPDGARLAFVSTRDANGELCYGDVCRTAAELYVMAADGSDQRRLTVSDEGEGDPAWSPDGSALAVVRGIVTGNAEAGSVWVLTIDGRCVRPIAHDRSRAVWYSGPAWRPGGTTVSPCELSATGSNVARTAPLAVAGLARARRSRAYPLVWLGAEYRGRRVTAVLRSDYSGRLPGVPRAPRVRNTTFIYGDCAAAPAGDDCRRIDIQVWPVCAVPPPGHPGRLQPMRRVAVAGAVADLYGGQWDLYTGSIVVRGFFTGRLAMNVMRSLRGLNALAGGVRPGALPPPAPGVLEGTLPCSRAWAFLGRPLPAP
jgi:WD40 repeat protein